MRPPSRDLGSTAHDEAGSRRLRTFASLRLPSYRVYFIAMLVYFGAMQMTVIARPWLAFELSADEMGQRSAMVLGLTVALNSAPSLVLSPLAGALADRMPKRNLLAIAAAAMAAFALVIAAGVAGGAFAWWHVTMLGLAEGIVMTFITPTRRAIISDLVDQRHLLNAVSLHTVMQNTNRTIMPAFAGLVIVVAGAEWAYVLIAVLYVTAIMILLAVPRTDPVPSALRGGMSTAVGDGIRYAAREPTIRSLLLIGIVAAVFGQPIQHLLPLFQDVLSIGAGELGLLYTFMGIGSLAGSTTAASLGDYQRKGLLLIGFFTVLGLAIIAFSVSTVFVVSLVLMLPVGFGQSGRIAVHVATLQGQASPEMRGRVMALNAMQDGFMPAAVLLITFAAHTVNPQVAMGSAGVVLLLYGLWEMIFSKTLRRLR